MCSRSRPGYQFASNAKPKRCGTCLATLFLLFPCLFPQTVFLRLFSVETVRVRRYINTRNIHKTSVISVIAQAENISSIRFELKSSKSTKSKMRGKIFAVLLVALFIAINVVSAKKWYSYEDGELAGKCGPTAPKIDGQEPICNPDDPLYHCCSRWGYCGTGPEYC